MRLKLFHAATMADALAQMRAELGADALILGTRAGRGGVEITAAAGQPADTPPEASLPAPPAYALAAGAPWRPPPAPGAELRRLAHAHGFTPTPDPGSDAGLEAALARQFRFARLDPAAGPILCAGPPGAGKTLTVARLATRLVFAGSRPRIVTADDQRAAAPAQLAAYTRLLGLDLVAAASPASLIVALGGGTGPALIDSAGIDCRDPAQMQRLLDLAQTVGARILLVLPAGLDAQEAADIAHGFAALGATMLAATRLDLARRLGSLLEAAHRSGLALAEAGIGPDASHGLQPFTPSLLAARLRGAPTLAGTQP